MRGKQNSSPQFQSSYSCVQRVIILVLDGVGVGELPDAANYGDAGSNTLVHLAEAVGGLSLPHLQQLGLGNIVPLPGLPPTPKPAASWGQMAERSAGKDSTTGHWELAGLILERPFPTYPHGFPPEIIARFEAAIGRRVLGNKPASGTVIIEELGPEHLRTGWPIVYTSADSVFQIAAHEEVIPLEELYAMCRQARKILTGEHAVARVIARPFLGEPGHFRRTSRRHDFSLPPPRPTLLDRAVAAGLPMRTVGKVVDLFAQRGITHCEPAANNAEALQRTVAALQEQEEGLLWTTLVDFDMLYGHRNDPWGFATALAELDASLPDLVAALRPSDRLILTADHGNDPTTPSTDHSREYVPLLSVAPGQSGRNLGIRATFADVAATVARWLHLPAPEAGTPWEG